MGCWDLSFEVRGTTSFGTPALRNYSDVLVISFVRGI
jgi:hypothetical protein